MSAFTPEQEARVREIIREEIAVALRPAEQAAAAATKALKDWDDQPIPGAD